jgi:hypothetical protein
MTGAKGAIRAGIMTFSLKVHSKTMHSVTVN